MRKPKFPIRVPWRADGPTNCLTRRRPMTLIELLIVLALLGGLATLALTGVGEMSSRNRVEVTRQRLDLIRTAVVGDGVSAGRFLADMGRLPVVQEASEGLTLSELWKKPSGIAYGSASMNNPSWPDDGTGGNPDLMNDLPNEVTLDCGWNGPYTMLSGDELYDGFGNEFLIANKADPAAEADWDETSATSVGDTVHGVLSRGLEDVYGDNGWAQADRSIVFDDLTSDTSLTVTVKGRDASGEPVIWTAPENTQVWNADTAYDVGDTIVDTSLDFVFHCTTAGTTDTSEPAWDTSAIGATTTDGTVEWEYAGTLTKHGHALNRLRVALFVPNVGQNSKSVNWQTDWSFASETTLTGLKPGVRKLYVYGFLDGAGSTANARASGAAPQTIELKPGANFVTVYLTEKL